MNTPHLRGCPNIDCHNNKDCCPFRKIVIPSIMGGDSEGEDYAPENGAYRNALVEYESNGHIYIYSSDGIPTRVTGESGVADYEALTNKPSINGHELIGNKTAEELGITSPEPLYVYCVDTQPGDPEPVEGVYIYKDAPYGIPITAGEILDAYRNGDRIVFATNSPWTPSPDSYTSYVYNELTRASVTYANGTSQPATKVRFYIMNNRAGADVPGLLSQACWTATSPSDTWLSITRVNAQERLTAGDGITISGNVISATGGGGATMFYADLMNLGAPALSIYTDASQSDYVDDAAMIAALSRGPVMIRDMNDNNIFVTVVSANGSSGPVSIVIDMYDDRGDPATRRFEFEGPDWIETRLS